MCGSECSSAGADTRTRLGVDLVPFLHEPGDVPAEFLGGRALGGGSNDDPVTFGPDPVEHAAQALALAVVETLRDARGVRLRHEHDEAARERDLLGETGALHADRVLGDLADDRLAGPQQVLDPGRARVALDPLVAVRLHVAPVQDGVLRRADVDERRLHPRQHVLHPAAVDVAVDLGGIVEDAGDVVLDERAALQDGDLGDVRRDVDAHQVAPDRPALALPAAATAGAGAARLADFVRLPRRPIFGRRRRSCGAGRLPAAGAGRSVRRSRAAGIGDGLGPRLRGGAGPPAAPATSPTATARLRGALRDHPVRGGGDDPHGRGGAGVTNLRFGRRLRPAGYRREHLAPHRTPRNRRGSATLRRR